MGDPSGPSPAELYNDARFTADISNRMRVPDRISMSGDTSPTHSAHSSSGTAFGGERKFNDLGMSRRDPRLDMQVPDRILVAGGNGHIASKSTPRELQLERAFIPPTHEQVRVSTPPRRIRLGEHAFPSAAEDSSTASTLEDPDDYFRRRQARMYGRGDSSTEPSLDSPVRQAQDSTSLALLAESPEALSPSQETQMIRRQIAKLNHRLLAVELENQQQQQREIVLTVLVSAYFIGKIIVWINRAM